MASEMGEIWRALREDRAETRRKNLRQGLENFAQVSAVCLRHDLHLMKSTDTHYLIQDSTRTVIQWWPSGNKWMDCRTNKVYSGKFDQLTSYVEKEFTK